MDKFTQDEASILKAKIEYLSKNVNRDIINTSIAIVNLISYVEANLINDPFLNGKNEENPYYTNESSCHIL
ncbi:hypothetical protein MXB_1142 [Myxobolus squamalis]|nr:hypothetical protein MXB_1142 [Myxobolus squamalis]